MRTLAFLAYVLLTLSALGLLALWVSYLALVDIVHGEVDIGAELMVLRGSFVLLSLQAIAGLWLSLRLIRRDR